jgi:NAD(P)-dependent dehydrogenase (short-subunit alcohol dehydrogenase family)
MDLNGISAIVTGGASGLGAATATVLAQRGAKVVLADLDRQQDKGDVLAKELGGMFVPCDVTDAEQVTAAVEAARELGPLRALVTAAGIGWATRTIGRDGQYASAHDLSLFSKVVEINLVGTFNCIRLAASAMSRNEPLDDGERGSILTVASIAAFDGQIGQAAYSASKGGVVGMTLPVARDLAVAGIRVNCIAPGQIDTPIYGSGEGSEAFKDRLKKDILFPKRFGHPGEFASLAVELLSNSFMNAEVVRIDGGVRMPPK